MDDFLKDAHRLFAMAKNIEPPSPLDATEVMRRIGGVSPLPSGLSSRSGGSGVTFFVCVGSAAAVLAVVVAAFAVSAWASLNDPLGRIEALPDIMSFLNIG